MQDRSSSFSNYSSSTDDEIDVSPRPIQDNFAELLAKTNNATDKMQKLLFYIHDALSRVNVLDIFSTMNIVALLDLLEKHTPQEFVNHDDYYRAKINLMHAIGFSYLTEQEFDKSIYFLTSAFEILTKLQSKSLHDLANAYSQLKYLSLITLPVVDKDKNYLPLLVETQKKIVQLLESRVDYRNLNDRKLLADICIHSALLILNYQGHLVQTCYDEFYHEKNNSNLPSDTLSADSYAVAFDFFEKAEMLRPIGNPILAYGYLDQSREEGNEEIGDVFFALIPEFLKKQKLPTHPAIGFDEFFKNIIIALDFSKESLELKPKQNRVLDLLWISKLKHNQEFYNTIYKDTLDVLLEAIANPSPDYFHELIKERGYPLSLRKYETIDGHERVTTITLASLINNSELEASKKAQLMQFLEDHTKAQSILVDNEPQSSPQININEKSKSNPLSVAKSAYSFKDKATKFILHSKNLTAHQPAISFFKNLQPKSFVDIKPAENKFKP